MPMPEFVKGLARWLATLTGLPLAENTPGAMSATSLLPEAQPPAEDDTSPERLEAKARYEKWIDVDPFPQIQPSLLNAADIDDYMRATAMVFPYDPEKRKTASYPLSVGNEIAYWDPGNPDAVPIRTLPEGAEIRIPPNSLVYVRTCQLFQLPNYMAVRFNLHIDLVHKGLLLGTGPLVDPGFIGKLMVPLHNLTSNTYVLQVGDDFIWAEFTKTSVIGRWLELTDRPERSGVPVEFEERKTNQTIADYINKARLGHKILQHGYSHWALQNALPDTIRETHDLAESARTSAASAENRLLVAQTLIRGFGGIAVLGALLALVSVHQATMSSQQTTQGLVDTTNERVRDQGVRVKELERQVQELQTQMKRPPPAPNRRGGA